MKTGNRKYNKIKNVNILLSLDRFPDTSMEDALSSTKG